MDIAKKFHLDAESGKIKLHHRVFTRGHISIKDGARICQYKGRYGEGYTIECPIRQIGIHGKYSDRYHCKEYYIFANK